MSLVVSPLTDSGRGRRRSRATRRITGCRLLLYLRWPRHGALVKRPTASHVGRSSGGSLARAAADRPPRGHPYSPVATEPRNTATA